MSGTIWLSAEIMADVGEQHRLAANEIEKEVNARTDAASYGDGFGSLHLISIILSEDGPDYDEVKKYWKKRKVFEFRLKIPHATFKAADPLGHRKLIVESILRAVDEARKKNIRDIDYDKLEADIRRVAASKGWL
jgi:hypothetical protein